MIVRVPCRRCHRLARFDAATAPDELHCGRCGEITRLDAGPALRAGKLETCPVCAKAYFYREKDFNSWVGGAVLLSAAVAFLVFANRNLWLAMSFLGAAAVLDLVVYSLVPFRFICYDCLSSFHGAQDDPKIGPYDLGTAGRFADDYEEQRGKHGE